MPESDARSVKCPVLEFKQDCLQDGHWKAIVTQTWYDVPQQQGMDEVAEIWVLGSVM